jgi:wyosine [tRNA(Phe)-imidazoG37] synthetase (radical SAM superfamily)
VRCFGPVPSRRLGRSLGINNIPAKVCPYACAYCQVGRTTRMQVERRAFYAPDEIVRDVYDRAAEAGEAGERIDYLTFVPDGEPTLDVHLGREIAQLKHLGIDIAVITNSSLIWQEDVRQDLMGADWVSLKVDAVRDPIWRQINRPCKELRLASILDGMLEFAAGYRGQLVTETMLVDGLNDGADDVEAVGEFLSRLGPDIAYLSIPTRPPAREWVRAPDEDAVNRAYQILRQRVDRVEYLIGYEGNAFASTGDVARDLLSITAVHPMREDAVDALLARAGQDWALVRDLIAQDLLSETPYGGHRFYTRRFPRDRRADPS